MKGIILPALIAGLTASAPAAETNLTISNGVVSRQLSQTDGKLRTIKLGNSLSKRDEQPVNAAEFAVTYRLTDSKESRRVTTDDFRIQGTDSKDTAKGRQTTFHLKSDSAPFTLDVRYSANAGEAWMRKQLEITAGKPIVIEKVEVENLPIPEADSAYKANQITAQGPGKWRPPLGQPVYARSSATWWGMEFPAARNEVKGGQLVCGYLTSVPLEAGATWTSHSAAVGAADDVAFIKDAFLSYINKTRARPLRLQTQYNSWFDYGKNVDKEKFLSSVQKVNDELCVKRGVPPLRAYVIDDGWQDTDADWSKTGVWQINGKFAADFADSRKAVAAAKSELGLWLSPGCVFGGQKAIPKMKAAGWKSLDPWMSMTGENYMNALEKRMTGLAASGVGYFKLDGVFGHLRTRNFDVEGFKGSEAELNNAKYDDAKERYLSLGSERLIQIFDKMGKANPNVYIVISNGAFLSSWWLQHIDAVWMINAADGAKGAGRTEQLVYRDSIYHTITSPAADHTQFPLNSIFNHEPKKIDTGEDAETFRRYLLMNFSRGTGFAELYLKTHELSDSDWSVLAESMKWLHHAFPAFSRSRMIGGNPGRSEVYGFSGWTDQLGYVSLHNPSDQAKEFTITFDRALGLDPKIIAAKVTYRIDSPLKADIGNLGPTVTAGGSLKITLPPRAIRILEFQR